MQTDPMRLLVIAVAPFSFHFSVILRRKMGTPTFNSRIPAATCIFCMGCRRFQPVMEFFIQNSEFSRGSTVDLSRNVQLKNTQTINDTGRAAFCGAERSGTEKNTARRVKALRTAVGAAPMNGGSRRRWQTPQPCDFVDRAEQLPPLRPARCLRHRPMQGVLHQKPASANFSRFSRILLFTNPKNVL